MIIRCQLKNFIIWPIQHSKSLWSRNKNHYSPISLTSTTLSSHKRFCINIWIPSRSEQIFTSDTSIRSLLIHVNNGISSAKSFGEDNLSTNPASLSLQKKREGRKKGKERKEKKRKEKGGRGHEFVHTTSFLNREPITAIQFQTMSDVEKRSEQN